jgi:predicted MFS family arabinose efflux permease
VGIGACVVAASLGVGSLAPGYASLLVVMLLVGAGYSTVQPGGGKSVASWFAVSRRGLAMGVRQAGLPLGGMLAAAVMPLLAATYGWRATLVTGGAVALLGAGVFMGFYRRPPVQEPPLDEPRPAPAPRSGGRMALLREPAMMKIVLSGTCLVSVHSAVSVLTVLYLYEVTSLGAGSAALALVAAQAAGAAGRIGLAAWSDRRPAGRYSTVMACMAAVTVGMAALMSPLGQSPAVACPLLVWLGFFGIGWYGPWVAYLAESAPPGRTGFALGLAMSVTQLAVVVAPTVLGLLKDATGGFTAPWALLVALTTVALVTTARIGRTPH